jgi:phage terminase small subunit
VTETLKKKELREQLFAREYLVDLNGTRAAIAAGYSSKTASSGGFADAKERHGRDPLALH